MGATAGRHRNGLQCGPSVARRLSGFDVNVVAYDPYVPPSATEQSGARAIALDDLLGTEDIVTLDLPLTAEMSGLLDARRLAPLRPSAYLINTARGGILDEEALARRFREDLLRGTGLDCFAVGPPGVIPCWCCRRWCSVRMLVCTRGKPSLWIKDATL